MHSADSLGRRYHEPEHPYRGPFQRDRDRIVHSSAYRRLSGKMQVFTGDMGDYHRTRLTHTHEVASLARTIQARIDGFHQRLGDRRQTLPLRNRRQVLEANALAARLDADVALRALDAPVRPRLGPGAARRVR